jgi:hypothetical protein
MKKGLLLLALASVFAFVFAGCASAPAASAGASAGQTTAAAASSTSSAATSLFNFESNTTDGWHGNGKWGKRMTVNADPKFVTEGKYSLKIDAKGCAGWNQDVAIFEGPFNENFGKFTSISMDVIVPKESIAGTEYAQIFVVISGSANSWYQIPQGLKEGVNKLTYTIDKANTSGDIWKMYLVFNSGKAFDGPVYIDNITANQ